MELSIAQDTFKAIGKNKFGCEVGTVEVNGKTQKAICSQFGIELYGYVGYYRTGSRAWMAHVSLEPNGRIYVHFGRDDRSGRYNKLNAIRYQPELFASLSNDEYWNVAKD